MAERLNPAEQKIESRSMICWNATILDDFCYIP